MKYDLDVVTSNKSKWENSKKFIVLHHTATVTTLENMVSYLSKPNDRNVSCHYVISQDWRLGKIWLDSYILWHAWFGNLIKWYRDNMNEHSIGIEVISNGEHFTRVQIEKLSLLVFELQKQYNIPKENVIRHKDYSTRKWDIWDNFYKLHWFMNYEHWLDRNPKIDSFNWVSILWKPQPKNKPLRLGMFNPFNNTIVLYDRAYRVDPERFQSLLQHEWSHKVYWTEFTAEEVKTWEAISRLDDRALTQVKTKWINSYWINKYISPWETNESEDFAETWQDIIKNPDIIYGDYRDIKRMAVRKLMARHDYIA